MRKQTVILADDHKLVRDGLRRIIEETKEYRIIGEAEHADDAIRNVKKLNPKILILDISMPDAQGVATIRKIRKFNKQIRILVVTMHKNEECVSECLLAGANGYVLKEDADTELIEAIKAVGKGKIHVSPLFTSEVIQNLLTHWRVPRTSSSNITLTKLTPREHEILTLIADGNSNKAISKHLTISVRTVEHHRLSIMRKLNVSSTVELIKSAIKNGLVHFTKEDIRP
jgi:DNA-binding NarL/FixJ family response regulator